MNKGYRNHLANRLDGEQQDIEKDGFTTNGIIDVEVIRFENGRKRTVNITDRSLPAEDVTIQGLKENMQKRFRNNNLVMSR